MSNSHAALIEDVLALGVHADQTGFPRLYDAGTPVLRTVRHQPPTPWPYSPTWRERTEHLRFRALCHTLPLHNPMVLAGEIAMVDILTKGRIECGVGRGHPWLCGPADVPMEESMGRYVESLEILQKAWTEERFSYSGEYFNVKDVSVVPKPVQKPHPKIYQVGTSAKWFTMAAQKEWGIVVGGPAPQYRFQGRSERLP